MTATVFTNDLNNPPAGSSAAAVIAGAIESMGGVGGPFAPVPLIGAGFQHQVQVSQVIHKYLPACCKHPTCPVFPPASYPRRRSEIYQTPPTLPCRVTQRRRHPRRCIIPRRRCNHCRTNSWKLLSTQSGWEKSLFPGRGVGKCFFLTMSQGLAMPYLQ